MINLISVIIFVLAILGLISPIFGLGLLIITALFSNYQWLFLYVILLTFHSSPWLIIMTVGLSYGVSWLGYYLLYPIIGSRQQIKIKSII